MNKSLLFVALFAFAAFASASTSKFDSLHTVWSTWKLQHKKLYSASEELMRFGIFVQNLEKIAQMNAESTTARFGVNKFADLTLAEFEQIYLNSQEQQADVIDEVADFDSIDYIPNDIDWRNFGAVNPIKDQKNCGSCWSFAAAGVVEGYHYIKSGKLYDVSEQELVDCSSSYGNYGCNGGLTTQAYSYIKDHGITIESVYPYTAKDGKCNAPTEKEVHINGWVSVPPKSSLAVKSALLFGLVSISVEVNDNFRFYKSGVFSSTCGTALNHAIIAVGFSNSADGEAFIVRNSWGTSWGEEGYIRLTTDQSINNGSGICGMLIRPSSVF